MRILPTATLLLALAATPVFAAEPPSMQATMPAWEQLSPSQRDVVIAMVRDRWNSHPEGRARFFAHAQRWRQMTPEQRAHAHHGMRLWRHMDPQKRETMRALFERMMTMTPEQRRALRDQWRAMTPDQRRAWVAANPPSGDD